MRHQSITTLFLIIFLLSTLSGCTSSIKSIPNVGIPLDEFNTDLEISFNPQWNKFRVGQDLVATIKLVSQTEMIAPLDFNLQLYVYDEKGDEWIKVENSGRYFGTGHTLDAINNSIFFSFCPVIDQDQKKPVSVLVLLFGYEIKNGQTTDVMLGAYTVIKLYPK